MALLKIVSFGFKHEGRPHTPAGTMVIDIRDQFWNPYHNPALRNKRGTDPEVQKVIMMTPDFQAKYERLRQRVTAGAEIVFIGCTGGRHRSVFLAEKLAKELGVAVEHRDIDRR